eukprot:6475260-Amphidinium_carterae.2
MVFAAAASKISERKRIGHLLNVITAIGAFHPTCDLHFKVFDGRATRIRGHLTAWSVAQVKEQLGQWSIGEELMFDLGWPTSKIGTKIVSRRFTR